MGIDNTVGHRTALLRAAAFLALAGCVALGIVDTPGASQATRANAPSSSSTFDALTTVGSSPGTKSSVLSRRNSTSVRGDEIARQYPPGTAPPTSSPPTTDGAPGAQFDVAVPALGAHAGAGQGDGSCTTFNLTALAPDGCPQPSGSGPVVVHYSGPGTGPKHRAAI